MYGETQEKLDEQTKINIKPKKSPFPQDRINNLAKVTAETDLSQQSHLNAFANSVENINHSILDDNLKTNAEFRRDAGLKVYITRLGGHKCCDWCAELVGRFEITDASADIWRRHQNCTCEILYENRKAGKYEKTKAKTFDHIRFIDTPDGAKKITTRLTPEQAKQTEQRAMQKFNQRFAKPLTNGANSGIIEERPFEIKKSREERLKIIERGIKEERPIFVYDTEINKFATLVGNVPAKENFYDVALHGKPTYAEFFGEPIDAYTLANVIRNRKDYDAGTKIRLLSCSTGNTEETGNCFAQLLANELGAVVEAPTKDIYVYPNGNFTVGILDDGEMKLFYPRK